MIKTKINGEIANTISYLTPTVQCVVYGLKFKGFWRFWHSATLNLGVRVKELVGYSTVTVSVVEGRASEELLSGTRNNVSKFSSQDMLHEREVSDRV